jgi:hypothetical protein
VELLSPMVETYGFTFNAYSGALDSVLRGELAFTPNKPYNTGTDTFLDLLGAFQAMGTLPQPGTDHGGGGAHAATVRNTERPECAGLVVFRG